MEWMSDIRVAPNNEAKLHKSGLLLAERNGASMTERLSAPKLVKIDRVDAGEDVGEMAQQAGDDPYEAMDRFERKVEKLAEKILQNRRFTPLMVYAEGRGFIVRDGHHRLAALKMIPGFTHVWVQTILDSRGAPVRSL